MKIFASLYSMIVLSLSRMASSRGLSSIVDETRLDTSSSVVRSFEFCRSISLWPIFSLQPLLSMVSSGRDKRTVFLIVNQILSNINNRNTSGQRLQYNDSVILGMMTSWAERYSQAYPDQYIQGWCLFMQTISLGSSGPDVRLVQSLLNRIGYNAGAVDGIFGPRTYQAV